MATVYGNLQGLKANHIKQLEQMYGERLISDRFIADAFRATLEEVTDADALLHVVDLSHPAWDRHIQSVEAVLSDLPAIPPNELLVFNKADRTDSETLAQVQQIYPRAVFISATERLGLETLRKRLIQLVETEVPQSDKVSR